MIKKFEEIRGELEKMREAGSPKGDPTGLITLDEFFTLRQGSFTFILGAPHQGKTEFALELIFNQTRLKKKCLVSSSETGNVAEIYAELIHKYTGKSIYKDSNNLIRDDKYYDAARWVDQWFSVVDTEDRTYSFQELFDLTTDEEIILADPYNEHKHNMTDFGTRQDLYIEEEIGNVRRYCKKNNKHMLITLHPASQQIKEYKESKDSKNSIRYYPMPMAREAAGGQALFRKAMTWINIWRPPAGMKDDHGRLYDYNQMVYMIEKAKPKGVAKKGIGSLWFDENYNRYYEKIRGNNYFAFQHEGIASLPKPLVDMTEKITAEEVQTDLPF